MLERTPREKQLWRSGNSRLETLFASVPTYVNREITLPCATTPLYVAPYPIDLKDYLHVIATPDTYQYINGWARNKVRIQASAQENGRVLEADEPIEIHGQPYIVTTKGGGATSFVREGIVGLQPTIHDIFDQPLKKTVQNPRLLTFPFSMDSGWLDKDDAFAEKEQAEKFRAAGLQVEEVLGIFRIDALRDTTGHLQPITFFRDNGTLGETTTPVLLVRIAKENLRLQDIARLEDLGYPEAAGKLITHATYQFTRDRRHVGNEEEYFAGMTETLVTDLLPLFLQGYTFASHAWQDAARNITITGEEVDVSELVETQVTNDRSYYLFQLRNHSYRLLTIVLLRLAEQIQRHSRYAFMDGAQVIQHATEGVLKEFDFAKIERQMRNQSGGLVKHLKREVTEDLKETLEQVEASYRRGRLSTAIFRAQTF